MKIASAQLAAAEAALARVLPMMQPADAVLSSYFRSHPQLGQHDRAFIAETVFGVLRRRYGLEHHTGATTPRRLLLAYLNRTQGVSLRQLEPLLGSDDAQWAAALRAAPGSQPPLHVAAAASVLPERRRSVPKNSGRRPLAVNLPVLTYSRCCRLKSRAKPVVSDTLVSR